MKVYDKFFLGFGEKASFEIGAKVVCPPKTAALTAPQEAGKLRRGANILAEFMGGAFTCDAHHMTDPRPDGLGVSSCIESALRYSGVDRDQVNYINAHATSTLVGDVAELNAVKKAFSHTTNLKMNATKSMTGHSLGAAGGLEGIACVKAIQTGWLHPSINIDDQIDEVGDINTCANVKQEQKVDVAISNSFGFGGHNSVVVFAPFKEDH